MLSQAERWVFCYKHCIVIQINGQMIIDCKYEKLDVSKAGYVELNMQGISSVLFKDCTGRNSKECPLNKEKNGNTPKTS